MFHKIRSLLGRTSNVEVVSYYTPISDDWDEEQVPDPYVENDVANASVWLRFPEDGLEFPVWMMGSGSTFFGMYTGFGDGEETVLGEDVATLLTLTEDTADAWQDVYDEQPFHIKTFCTNIVERWNSDAEISTEMETLMRWAMQNSEVIDNG